MYDGADVLLLGRRHHADGKLSSSNRGQSELCIDSYSVRISPFLSLCCEGRSVRMEEGVRIEAEGEADGRLDAEGYLEAGAAPGVQLHP